MKKIFVLLLFSITFIVACKKEKNGKVTFGANYNIISTPVKVIVYIDNEEKGTLSNPVNSITDCDVSGNVTVELENGTHAYKVVIIQISSNGTLATLTKEFTLEKNDCKKFFIDCSKIQLN